MKKWVSILRNIEQRILCWIRLSFFSKTKFSKCQYRAVFKDLLFEHYLYNKKPDLSWYIYIIYINMLRSTDVLSKKINSDEFQWKMIIVLKLTYHGIKFLFQFHWLMILFINDKGDDKNIFLVRVHRLFLDFGYDWYFMFSLFKFLRQ